MLRLRRFDFNVKGGYQYIQAETGMKFDGNTPFRPQANQIALHRKANNLARATFDEAAQDLEAATCARVPGVCYETQRKFSAPAENMAKASRGCGSCGGRKAIR